MRLPVGRGGAARPPFGVLELAAELRSEGFVGVEMLGEAFEGSEGFRAHVVFHAFDVARDDMLFEPELTEKIGEELVAMSDVGGDGFASGGEDHAAVFLVVYQSLGIEALHHGGDTGLGDLELGRDVDDPSVTLGVYELADALKVVFHRRGGARERVSGVEGHGLTQITPR